MEIKDLSPNPDNPRKVTEKKLEQLRKALLEFGDLGGIVFNRVTKQLVGGHQRARLMDADAEVVIEQKYKKPTKTGTVAEGYILLNGERFKYREVSWDAVKEKAANIAANKLAGEFDKGRLASWMQELQDYNFDLDFTMFDSQERVKFFSDSEKKPEDEKKSRVTSSDVVSFQLTFTSAAASEFTGLVEHFQKLLNIDSITDTILEVLRLAKDGSSQ